jgi:DNA excision repair protein ERCC-4
MGEIASWRYWHSYITDSAHLSRHALSMKLRVDVHERASGVPRALREIGVEFVEAHLVVGDYLIGEVAAIERKTTRGLHFSIRDGRFWRQLGGLRRATLWPYLLVEGNSIYDGPLGDEAVRGILLAVADLGVTVVRSRNPAESALWIHRIQQRRTSQRDVNRPAYAQRPQREPNVSPSERALAAASGVSTTTARALLIEFGCLRDVLLASAADLRRVPGVGTKRAQSIEAMATEQLAIPASAEIA